MGFTHQYRQKHLAYIRTLYDQQKTYGHISAIREIHLTLKTDSTATDSMMLETKYSNDGNIYQETYSEIHHVPANVQVFDVNGDELQARRFKSKVKWRYLTKKRERGGKEIIFDQAGQREIYRFDKSGLLINRKKYQGYPYKQLLENSLYKYDSGGNLIEEEQYNSKNNLYGYVTYKYDNMGLLTEKSQCYLKDTKTNSIHLYSYDKADMDGFGNWVKRIEKKFKKNDTVTQIVTRQIEYKK